VSKRSYGETVGKIIAALAECGEMTAKEICDHIRIKRDGVSTILTRMRRDLPTTPKRVYVVRYVYDAEGLRRYPRPVYALGTEADAPKPKAPTPENRKRYRERLRLRMTANSVFNLGLTRREYTAVMKARKL